MANKGKNISLEDIKETFFVEKLSKDFFNEYKKQSTAFCEYLMDKPGIKAAIFNGNEKAIRDFAKKLLGRIVFLYFIQKKGWLGVPMQDEWGKGNIHFLSNLFEEFPDKKQFYSQILTSLFFDTLNKPGENDRIELIQGKPCRIPFLNSGLFESDNVKLRSIDFDENLFQNLFHFMNQYNFTIYEDDPGDHTIAVDPEML